MEISGVRTLFPHAVLYHEQRRHALVHNVRIGADGQQTQNHHDHEQRIDNPADAHALDGIIRLFKRLGVLNKHRDIGELESTVQKCRIQRLAERRRLCGHRMHGLCNGAGAAIMFGMYTTSRPAMMQTDKTEATLRTRSVPKIATMK